MPISDRIVVAVDFSEPSKIAALAAFEFAGQVGAKHLTMIHSVKPVVFPAGSLPVVRQQLEALRERIHRAAEEQLRSMCAELAPPEGLTLEHRILEGRPAEVIPEAVRDLQASLLIVGSHARRGVKRWLSGSIAESVLERTPAPTLLMVTGDDGVPPHAELKNVETMLVAIDDSAHASEVARVACEVAKSFGKKPRVVLLYVVEPTGIEMLLADDPDVTSYMTMLEDAGRSAAAELASRLDRSGLEVEVVVQSGQADEVILAEAKVLPARLIVIGARAALGSTVAHVVRHSNVPVLVVPEREPRE